jgi:uncharacterized membrane protein YfcA
MMTAPAVENPLLFYIAMGLACTITGLSKGGLGGMMGTLVVPMLALVMPIDLAIGLMLPILLLGDVFTVAAHWRRWEARLIWSLLLGALVGVTAGTFFLISLPADLLRRGLGIIVLSFVIYRLFEQRILRGLQYRTRRWHALLAGGLAGLTSTLAHAGGPLITIYLLLQGLAPPVFVATAALFFTALNWIKVPYYFYAGLFDFDLQLKLAWLMPLVPLGVWLGKRLVERIDRILFERIIIILLAISGLLFLVR